LSTGLVAKSIWPVRNATWPGSWIPPAPGLVTSWLSSTRRLGPRRGSTVRGPANPARDRLIAWRHGRMTALCHERPPFRLPCGPPSALPPRRPSPTALHSRLSRQTQSCTVRPMGSPGFLLPRAPRRQRRLRIDPSQQFTYHHLTESLASSRFEGGRPERCRMALPGSRPGVRGVQAA
jgi:hypothetical protein